MTEIQTNQSREELSLIRKISIRLIPFMLILYVVSYLDRINVSFAALEMNKALGFSDEAFGFGAGIFFFGYFLFGIPSNVVIEKLGARLWISSIMIIWGILTVVTCLIKDATQFYILRFVLGLAEAGFFPGMIFYLTYWFPPKYYGVAVARFMVAIPIAGLVGSAVAAKALDMGGIMGLSGWMWLFIVTGLPAVFLGVLVLYLMPDRPAEAKWLTGEEARLVESMVGSVDKSKKGGLGAFVITLKQLSVWRFALLYFSLTISMYGFQLWLPQIIKTFGDLSNSTTAWISAIPALFQGLGMLVIAGHSDKSGERKLHVVAATIATCVGLCLCSLVDNPYVKMLGLCIAAFGIWGSVGPFWALVTKCLKREFHPTGIALINSVGNLGGFTGPYLVGFIKQYAHGFGSALFALAVASVLAGIIAFTSREVEADQ